MDKRQRAQTEIQKILCKEKAILRLIEHGYRLCRDIAWSPSSEILKKVMVGILGNLL